ncbi:tetratricopeptide repeat protein [Microbacterium sp. P04]|uniref:tetratricopeptide repeat protein n=1 Tax=Microbacterium sp. P04 TaxID=3366947 RepID=UPI003744FEE4
MVDDVGASNADWRMQPDWVEHLAQEVGNALVVDGDDQALQLLEEVDGLISSGNTSAAAWVARAALYRATHGRVTDKSFDVEALFADGELRADLERARRSMGADELRAAALSAVGHVLVSEREYALARDAHTAAAAAWEVLGKATAAALELLRAGAAVFHVDGGLEEAVHFGSRSREAYRAVGDVRGSLWAALNVVQAESERGNFLAVHELLQEIREDRVGLRDGRISASIGLEEALLAAKSGDAVGARRGFAQAYRSSRRRGDLDQAFVAAKNLAIVAAELQQSGQSIRWWQVAAGLAAQSNDWRDHQDVLRLLGVALAKAERFSEAVAALDMAAKLNREHGDDHEAARTLADRAAVDLEYAIKGDLPDEIFEEVAARGRQDLLDAKSELEGVEDFEWASIAARNLRTSWILANAELEGAEMLALSADRFENEQPDYTRELRRNAAWLLLAAGTEADHQDTRPARWLIDAVVPETDNDVDRAWDLAKEAATAAEKGFDVTALRLYDAAIERVDRNANPSAYGNILNDSVLSLARMGELGKVRQRLVEVETIANGTEDRVLLGLVLSNLGETAVRQDDLPSARKYYRRSVQMAQQTGDDERVSITLAALANTYLGDTENIEVAAQLSARALDSARRAGTEEAWLRSNSSAASVAYARQRYEEAYRLWMECVNAETAEDGAEHQAYALDALAQTGDWPRYRRELDRLTRRAQAADAQFALIEKLHLSALTWLAHGRAAPAGTVLAYAVLLGFEAASKGYGRNGRTLSTAERERAIYRAAGAMGALRAVLVLFNLPERTRGIVRRAYERTIRRAAGEDAEELLKTVDHHVYAPLDEDDANMDGTQAAPGHRPTT